MNDKQPLKKRLFHQWLFYSVLDDRIHHRMKGIGEEAAGPAAERPPRSAAGKGELWTVLSN